MNISAIKLSYCTYKTDLCEITIVSQAAQCGDMLVSLHFGSKPVLPVINDISINHNTADDCLISGPTALTDKAAAQLEEYFAGKRQQFDLPLKLYGTAFQRSVWNALTDIPYGETRSYKQIAQALGNPLACRAVGMANNRNPVSIIVPCHRVIGADGSLTGYGGGLELKEKLLKLEKGFADVF